MKWEHLQTEPECLLVFVDDTGHEQLAGNHLVYGLGGIAMLARRYELEVRPAWRALRSTINGDPDAPLHAGELTRPVPQEHLDATAQFFRQRSFGRFAVTTDRQISLPPDLEPMQAVLGMLKEQIVQLAALTPTTSLALIFESSARADPLLMRFFGELAIQENGRSINVEHCLMPKGSNEPGLRRQISSPTWLAAELSGSSTGVRAFHGTFRQPSTLCRIRCAAICTSPGSRRALPKTTWRGLALPHKTLLSDVARQARSSSAGAERWNSAEFVPNRVINERCLGSPSRCVR